MYRSAVKVEGQTKEPDHRRCLMMVVEDERSGIKDVL